MHLTDWEVDQLTEFFEFLDELREEGVTNMYGARPYLIGEFDLENEPAGDILQAWMRTFSREDPPSARAQKAITDAGETETSAA